MIYIFQAEEGWKGDKKNEAAAVKRQEARKKDGNDEKAKELAPEVQRIKPNRKHIAVGLVACADRWDLGLLGSSQRLVCLWCHRRKYGWEFLLHGIRRSMQDHGYQTQTKIKLYCRLDMAFSHTKQTMSLLQCLARKGSQWHSENLLEGRCKMGFLPTRWIGLSCILMQLVFLAQLLITPQATFTGQVCLPRCFADWLVC